MDKQTKYVVSSMKITLNVLIVLVVSAVLLLFNFFVIDGVGDGKAHDLAYWMKKVMTAIGTFLVMIGIANVTEESLKRKNTQFLDRLNSLEENFHEVNEDGLAEQLDFFVRQKDKRNKYAAFVKKYKKKLAKCKPGDKAKREAIERKLAMTPDEVEASLEKVKYVKISYSQLVSGATDVNPKENEDDLNTHRVRLVFQKLVWKACALIGAALYLPELMSHFENFTLASILPLCIRIATILWSFYSGVCFGYTMLDRLLVVLRRKIKIFSEFLARTDDESLTDENRYIVTYEADAVVERAKQKYSTSARVREDEPTAPETEQVIKETANAPQNALQQVVADINHPITPGNFVSRVIKQHIENRVNQA